MKITCHSCGAKYAIADDKVRGRRVKVRCKGCRTAIVVDGYTMDADQAAAAADGGMEEDDATRVQASARDQEGADPNAWSVNLSDTDQRTMTTAEIADYWNSGQMPEDAYVWKEGMGDWMPIGDVPELVAAISAGGAPSQPPQAYPSASPAQAAPSEPQAAEGSSPFGGGFSFGGGGGPAEAARVSPGRAQAGVDLFGAAAAAGTDVEAGQVAPASSNYDDKMTGARNENSVLFSLDALKAGMTPSAQAPVAARPAADDKASLDDIMGVGAMGGGNALFGLAQNQSLLTAPAPPPDPPPRPVYPSDPGLGASASIAPGMAAPRNNKLIFALGGAVALLVIVVVVLGVAFMGGGDDKKVAQAENGEKTEKTNGDPKSGSGESSTEKKEEKSGEASGDAKPDAGPPKPSLPPGATEEDKKRFAEAMKKKAELDKKVAEEAKKEEVTKKEDPSSGVASFNKGAAIAALSSAASASTRCKKPDGPTGSGKAIVTFAPSGRVTSANVAGGAFGGTSVGGCVASVFRSARVPAFSGDSVTVSKSFTIPP